MMKKIKALFVEEQGQGMTEYGLVLGVVAVAAIAIIGLMGEQIKGLFDDMFGKVDGIKDKITP
ncbi:Flp family type IVb pilin [Pseudoneobacillus sp. C159]